MPYIILVAVLIVVGLVLSICILVSKKKELEGKIWTVEEEAANKINAAQRKAAQEIKAAKANSTAEIEKERERFAIQIRKERERSAADLRNERERILVEKEALMSKSEKELLVSIMVALNGYASRLDRTDSGLSSIKTAVSIVSTDVSKLIRKERTRVESECHFNGVITQNDFVEIVKNAVKKMPSSRRVRAYTDGAIVRGVAVTVNSHTEWTFELDFNDHGTITGNYWCNSDNEDSSIPNRLGEEIKKEIYYRLHSS